METKIRSVKTFQSYQRFALISLLLFGIVFLWSCGEEEVPPEKTNIVVSFVDLTGSVDGDTAESVKTKIVQFFSHLPDDATFYLYPVDNGTNVEPIFVHEPPSCEIKVESDKEKCTQQIFTDRRASMTKLQENLNIYQKKMSAPEVKRLSNSCLINKLITADNLFKSKYSDNKKYQLSLVFFSDMIEDCSQSVNNKLISFEKINDFNSIKIQIDRDLNINSEVANLKQLNVRPVIIHTIRKDSMPFYQLQELWDTVFNKFGFEKGEAFKFYWATELPNKDFWEIAK